MSEHVFLSSHLPFRAYRTREDIVEATIRLLATEDEDLIEDIWSWSGEGKFTVCSTVPGEQDMVLTRVEFVSR